MRGSRRKTAKSVLRVVEDRAGVPYGGVPLYSTPFCPLIGRVAHRAFEGGQAANRKGRAAMTKKNYCGNLLW